MFLAPLRFQSEAAPWVSLPFWGPRRKAAMRLETTVARRAAIGDGMRLGLCRARGAFIVQYTVGLIFCQYFTQPRTQ